MNMRKLFRVIMGLGIGLAFLMFSLRGVENQKLVASFTGISYSYLVVGLSVYLANFFLRTFRWKFILDKIGLNQYWKVNKSLYIGYAMNNILPARLGEVFRSVYAAKYLKLPVTEVLMTVFLERLCDFIMLLIIFIAGGVMVTAFTPTRISWLEPMILFGMLFLGCVFIGIIFRKLLLNLCLPVMPDIVCDKLNRIDVFLSGIDRKTILRLVLFSAIIWPIDIFSVFLLLMSLNLVAAVDFLLLLQGTAGLITLAPTAPGYVGSLQYAFRLVFEVFSASPSSAIVAATLIQLVYFGAVSIIGGILLFMPKSDR